MALPIVPVILCGGSGDRLWPLSGDETPKPFIKLIGDVSPFAETLARFSGAEFGAPVIVADTRQIAFIERELAAMGGKAAQIIQEPSSKNTAAAVLAASQLLADQKRDCMIVVTPADHLIPDAAAFRKAIFKGQGAALAGQIVTIGIHPERAETGFGYIEVPQDSPMHQEGPISPVRFVEKPDAQLAERMVSSGHYLWNAGVFLFTPATILKSFAEFAPEFMANMAQSFSEAGQSGRVFAPSPDGWDALPSQSVDVAIMEKAPNLSVVRYKGHWADLGSWRAIWSESQKDGAGNCLDESSHAIGCANSLLRSDVKNMRIFAVGLRNIAVVVSNGAVLVTDLDDSQRVRDVAVLAKTLGPIS